MAEARGIVKIIGFDPFPMCWVVLGRNLGRLSSRPGGGGEGRLRVRCELRRDKRQLGS